MPNSILIVDDEPRNIDLMRSVLSNIGRKLRFATDGRKALTQAERHLPDLILLDIMMPEMDGYEVCRRLKDNKKTRYIPIIFVTAKDTGDDELKGLQIGAVDYITKPINPAITKVRVKTHLKILEQNRKLVAQNKLLEKLQALQSDFINMTIHDLKNPLTVMLGHLGFMFADKPLMVTHSKFLLPMKRSVQKMQALVEELLTIGKLKKNVMSFLEQDVDVGELISFVAEDNQSIANTAEVNLTVNLPPLSTMIVADFSYIERVLTNLVSNAIKFSPKGSDVSVHVEIDSNRICIFVSDSGPGIPEELQPRLFEPFSQAKNQQKQGTGLGLTICKLATEGMGGEIGFNTEIGQGTIMWIKFPIT